MKRLITTLLFVLILTPVQSQQTNKKTTIKDLDFLIGIWEVREDNIEKAWWEKSTRVGAYILRGTVIELKTTAISSSGKERTYLWLIQYNKKTEQFEMVSIYSNWHIMLFDILHWDLEQRTLTIRNNKQRSTNEYSERFGKIVFEEDYNAYTWKGKNKYGDPNKPSIWNYIEKGTRIKEH